MGNKNNVNNDKKDLKVIFVLFLLLLGLASYFAVGSVKNGDHQGAAFAIFFPFYLLVASLVVKRLVDGKGYKNE